MGEQFIHTIETVALAIVGLGVVAVIVSRKAQTPQVIQAGASGFSNALGVAESPVTGASYRIDLSYPSSSGMGLQLPNLGYFGG